ncbi:xanthine dehydrogenase family protein subunit M [Saccharolobus solfataricus]|uniref:Carbon monoxide dehydrogenase, medium chain. (CutB-1) n=3 Tax=Saccharolobus solfataricus TaxID=2287 RepID=Q97W13_SACS2|nr:glyceraldehyde dehydrogenase subunit beta [Saccharolobus solfataricus]AAK42577.1 Carbon monoxide dehydrogenase, medium chain. (cutB-1) [Saccharolobus solfataricus P2]AKA72669.1 xanthine dehydrogenase family protein subunit M [Saccharolobus solfataricus]AKA75369.1 xanthine dehydrogenase family protein subunit M [Saccharolobus solfataricus]AKA78061.1 xanthine dehydrogenase family protein subunit M [Saccharolobus solfataricus]AZF67182.1 xanthine dehydrogenase family protein subunit M [Saccharo
MYPPKFSYVIPDNVKEALEFLETHDDAKPLAGGHSLIPMLKLRIFRPSYLVEIRRLPELKYIKMEGNVVKIGPIVTHYDIIKANIPLLSETASKIADPQVRNMGTIGGSISHLDPSADYPAALIAMNAKVRIRSTKGERVENFSSFAKDMFTPDLNPGELVTEIEVPLLKDYKFSYQKLERRAGDFAIVGVAVALKVNGDVIEDARIGLTAVNKTAVRASEAEKILLSGKISEKLIEEAATKAMDYANPTSDIRGSAEYKKKMVKVMTKRAILAALNR